MFDRRERTGALFFDRAVYIRRLSVGFFRYFRCAGDRMTGTKSKSRSWEALALSKVLPRSGAVSLILFPDAISVASEVRNRKCRLHFRSEVEFRGGWSRTASWFQVSVQLKVNNDASTFSQKKPGVRSIRLCRHFVRRRMLPLVRFIRQVGSYFVCQSVNMRVSLS